MSCVLYAVGTDLVLLSSMITELGLSLMLRGHFQIEIQTESLKYSPEKADAR